MKGGSGHKRTVTTRVRAWSWCMYLVIDPLLRVRFEQALVHSNEILQLSPVRRSGRYGVSEITDELVVRRHILGRRPGKRQACLCRFEPRVQ